MQTITRQEIEKDYEIRNGCIISPGKFESCPVYVPFFWFMDGEDEIYEDEGKICRKFNITEDDIDKFEELKNIKTLLLIEDFDGFIHFVRITKK
jgi:hypothetical protein